MQVPITEWGQTPHNTKWVLPLPHHLTEMLRAHWETRSSSFKDTSALTNFIQVDLARRPSWAFHRFLPRTGRHPVTSNSRFFLWFLHVSGICLVISRIAHSVLFSVSFSALSNQQLRTFQFSSEDIILCIYPFWRIRKFPKQSFGKGFWQWRCWGHTPVTPMPGATEQEDRVGLPGLYCSNTVTDEAKIKSPPQACPFFVSFRGSSWATEWVSDLSRIQLSKNKE